MWDSISTSESLATTSTPHTTLRHPDSPNASAWCGRGSCYHRKHIWELSWTNRVAMNEKGLAVGHFDHKGLHWLNNFQEDSQTWLYLFEFWHHSLFQTAYRWHQFPLSHCLRHLPSKGGTLLHLASQQITSGEVGKIELWHHTGTVSAFTTARTPWEEGRVGGA